MPGWSICYDCHTEPERAPYHAPETERRLGTRSQQPGSNTAQQKVQEHPVKAALTQRQRQHASPGESLEVHAPER